MNHDHVQEFAERFRAYWEQNKDSKFEIETSIALITANGAITKSYPGVTVKDIGVEGHWVEFEVDTKQGVPMWVLLPMANVASITDMTKLIAKMAPNIATPPQRKILG